GRHVEGARPDQRGHGLPDRVELELQRQFRRGVDLGGHGLGSSKGIAGWSVRRKTAYSSSCGVNGANASVFESQTNTDPAGSAKSGGSHTYYGGHLNYGLKCYALVTEWAR